MKYNMPKVSCVMPTYRRFTCVERSIACFLSQETELETELIICNTDVEYPLVLDDTFTNEEKNKIKIINNNIDFKTKRSYSNTGSIRRDGVSLSTGEYYITWDDDDIFLPWNIQQCYDGIIRTNARAWKPHRSIMWWKEEPIIDHNVLEATVMMYIDEATFDQNSGPEGMNWFNRLTNSGALISDEYSIPAYCYYWRDPKEIGGHKQGNSEDINKLNNFEIHMSQSIDLAKRKLTKHPLHTYKNILDKIRPLYQNLNSTLITKYISPSFW